MAEPDVKDGGHSSPGNFRASRKISTIELQWIPNKNQAQKQYEFFVSPVYARVIYLSRPDCSPEYSEENKSRSRHNVEGSFLYVYYISAGQTSLLQVQ